MLVVGILIFFVITFLPGFLALRLLRVSKLHTINALLYALGLGLIFNVIVGLVANFTFGFSLVPLVVAYVALLIILVAFSYKLGEKLPINWRFNWKSSAVMIPIGVYLLAVALQYQTTLLSPNLVGSDIHLEYWSANLTLENGFWDPMYAKWTINSCLGLTILIPLYSFLTGITIMDMFRIISPLVFAFLPLALYQIFKMQFGTIVAVLSVVFFVTMPMFTMDLVQLIRQQQSELFFILVVLLLMDDKLSLSRKIILGAIFGVGAITTHYGLSVGYVGYLAISSVVIIILAKAWKQKHEIEDASKPILPRLAMMAIVMIALVTYIGYYSWVNRGELIVIGTIPMQIVEGTVKQAVVGIEMEDAPVTDTPVGTPSVDTPTADTPAVDKITLIERFPFLNPFFKEPLTQTALGLDFAKASVLGKIWRVLQYLVQICLVIGLFRLLLKPNRKVRIEYVAFIITSFFVLAGVFILATHSWGLGVTRIWQVTLLFMSPLFVIGASTIGGWIARLKKGVMLDGRKLVVISTLVLFIPYFAFNFGIVFELAKCQPVGFIDVPYSIGLSGHRVDIASIFEKEDVEAVDWLKEYMFKTNDSRIVYSDTHGVQLLGQRMTYVVDRANPTTGSLSFMKWMDGESIGYIFLRKRTVDTGMVTYASEYASRQSYRLDESKIVKEKLETGTVIFDNGARIIRINEAE